MTEKRKRRPMVPRKATIKQRIDRVVPGVGRVALRTGARSKQEHQARLRLFDRLLEADQLDVVQMLVDRKVTWAELRQAERKKRLHSDALAADVALSRRLWDVDGVAGALSATLPRMGKSGSARERYAVAFRQLNEKASDFFPATAIVKDLRVVHWPQVWEAMHDLAPASRNRVRSAVSAFLTVFLGDKYHPFRREVVKLMGGMEDENVQPREITLDEFWTIFAKVPEAVQPAMVTLAATGMRIGEYLQCTEESIRRLPVIWIPNGKTGGAETSVAAHLIPWVKKAIPCRVAKAPTKWRGVQYDARYSRIYDAITAAASEAGIPCTPHYLRHLYAQLGTDELPAVLVQQGLRHKTEAMTGRYARRRTTQQVATTVGDALMASEKVRDKVWDGQ